MSRPLRIVTLFVPPLLAGGIIARGDASWLDVTSVLVFAWTVMTAALLVRLHEARKLARTYAERPDTWQHLDVLTAAGRAMMWSGFAAGVGAAFTGWASLSVVCVFGIGVTCIAATWNAIVAGGVLPWRTAKIERAILPASATEGDELREEIRASGVVIPAGMRLFVQGRPLRHGVTTRYLVGSEASNAEFKLESELGPAPRGEHQVPALAMWLGDVLGLTRTPVHFAGDTELVVVPRPMKVEGVRRLRDSGGDDLSMPTQRLPTEGSFRIRDYVPGDDTRRIHWVRSLQRDQLVVRLPDEVPQDEPTVRLVLDTHLEGIALLSCPATDELLDALVRVWLGVGKALAETGTQVTLATALAKDDGIAVATQVMTARPSRAVLRLGARVAWQPTLPLGALIAGGTRTVIVTCRPQVGAFDNTAWVVVPEPAWTTSLEWQGLGGSVLKLPFPTGSPENRRARREQERERMLGMWEDRWKLSGLVGSIDWHACTGEYVALPRDGKRVELEVIP